MSNARNVADALRYLCDWLDANSDDLPDLYASLSLGAADDGLPDDQKIALVDKLSLLMLGRVGATGVDIHHAHGRRGPLYVGIQASVASPAKRRLLAELAELNAQVEAARVERDRLAGTP